MAIQSPVRARPPIETPCVQVCEIDPASALCKGCYRSLEEIAIWASMTDGERRCVMDGLRDRGAAAGLDNEAAVIPK